MPETEADRVLEQVVGATLRASRPGGAPVGLRERVLAVPDQTQASWLRLVTRGTGWLVGGAVASAVVVVAVILALRPASQLSIPIPSGGGSQPAMTLDPTLVGPGIVTDVQPTLQWVPALAALVAVIVAVRFVALYRLEHRRTFALSAALAVAIAVGSVGLTQHAGFEWRGGSYGPVVGLTEVFPAPGSTGLETLYETAEPGAPVVFAVTVTNPGPLPIRLEGIVEPPLLPPNLRRWVALWLRIDPNGVDLRRFTPVDVAPHGSVDLFVVSRAGPCAYGSTFTLGIAGVTGYMRRDENLELAFSVFGLERQSQFTLPFEIVEPVRANCVG